MRFYSRGKLLFTGEYLVLKGATALTAPLLSGQSLVIKSSDQPGTLEWTSKEKGSTWFRALFTLPFFELIKSSDDVIAQNLKRYFRALGEFKPGFPNPDKGYFVISDLEFSRSWGFGSSSSLTSNLAYWAEVDPYLLHRKVSRGSGYDVVCAREEGPVFFSTDGPSYYVNPVDLHADVTTNLYFVYLGQKAHSDKAITKFLKKGKSYISEVQQISELSKHIALAEDIRDFDFYIKEHEQIIASILKMDPLKVTVFPDFQGEAKSMGAWGGDFALLTWQDERKDLENYLETKNFETYFSFNELIKTR